MITRLVTSLILQNEKKKLIVMAPRCTTLTLKLSSQTHLEELLYATPCKTIAYLLIMFQSRRLLFSAY